MDRSALAMACSIAEKTSVPVQSQLQLLDVHSGSTGFYLFFLILDALHALRRTSGPQPAIDKWIKFTVHHCLQIARFHTRAQILDHAIRLKYITADLVPPRNAAFIPVKAFHFRFLLVDPLGVNLG